MGLWKLEQQAGVHILLIRRNYSCNTLKDKNGKEIYEGDVLLYDGGDLPKEKWSKAVVEWDQQGMWTHPGHSNAPDDWFIRPSISEVIGNIHENPELLEQ